MTTIPKQSHEDTFFTTKNSKGESINVTVPKGTYVSINTPGLHYNRQFTFFISSGTNMIAIFFSARYWKDPHKFNPSRFIGDWPRDAFLPFSGGKYSRPRSYVLFLISFIQ